jgi:hypothetical protein
MCGVAQFRVRRGLVVRRLRPEFNSRLGTPGRFSHWAYWRWGDGENPCEWRRMNALYECGGMNVCTKIYKKKWHHAVEPLNLCKTPSPRWLQLFLRNTGCPLRKLFPRNGNWLQTEYNLALKMYSSSQGTYSGFFAKLLSRLSTVVLRNENLFPGEYSCVPVNQKAALKWV